jgi:hypothetical protein
MVHELPFQPSARVTVPVLPLASPTAVHKVGEVHETLTRELVVAPAGLGVDRMLQVVPFHDSARVMEEVLDVIAYPTAMQFDADVQETSLPPGSVWSGGPTRCRSTPPPAWRCCPI